MFDESPSGMSILASMNRFATLFVLGALIAAGFIYPTRANANPLAFVVDTLRSAGGHYRSASASLTAADCSGLVSVAQSLAMGQAPRRLGSTSTILAGRWPHAIRGAAPGDPFIIGVNSGHMVAQVGGVSIEATTSGRPFLIGPPATSVWAPQFTQYRIDPKVLRL